MIGTVNPAHADPALADRIRSVLAGHDPAASDYLSLGARLDAVSAVHDEPGAVAWRSLHATWNRPWIIGMGADPAAVARCAAALVDSGGPPEGITVERRAFPRLPSSFRPVEHWEWDWWFTTTPPPRRPGEDRVVTLDSADGRIPAMLAESSPDAMTRPGDPRIRGWWAIEASSLGDPGRTDRGAADQIVAIAVVTSMRSGVPHLGSVATHPDWRGLGLSRDLCARLTRDLLAEGSPAVTLGMHAANRAARAVYDSLGYTVGYRWASGRVAAEMH